MLANLVIWLVVMAVVSFVFRERDDDVTGTEHPDIVRTQSAYAATARGASRR